MLGGIFLYRSMFCNCDMLLVVLGRIAICSCGLVYCELGPI